MLICMRIAPSAASAAVEGGFFVCLLSGHFSLSLNNSVLQTNSFIVSEAA